MKTKNTLFRRLLLFCFMACLFTAKVSAQVTFLDSSLVTDEAFYFWKADNDKPYHYGAAINPHGNCIKTYNGYVFYTWYRGGWDDRTLMVSRQKIGSGAWKHVAFSGKKLSLVGGLGDTHLTTNIGICPIDGTVHIMFDHHNEDLNYIRSKPGIAFGPDEDFALDGFLPEQNYLIPGKKITSVTYPNLFNNDDGDMFFERRLGSAVGGEIIITYYNGEDWSAEKTIINGRSAVTQGERNFCYGNAYPINGTVYYTYSPRWAESPTTLGEGVYVMDVGPQMNKAATNVDGKSYNLPITEHAPFFIADPRSVPTTAGWAGGPSMAVSPKGDFYLNISPKNTEQYNYLRKAGETEFTEYRNKGSLGKFYGNRMYKFVETGGFLYVKSCQAGSYEWRTDYTLNIGANYDKSKIIMQDGIIAAVYKESKASATVPIRCFVFQVEKSEYTPQSITLQDVSEKTEGDANFEVTASATSQLPVTLVSSDDKVARVVDGNKVQIMGAGSCDIIANQGGDGVFDNAPEVRKTLVVKANTAKQTQTISFSLSSTDYVWGTPDEALSATASSGLAVVFESTDTDVAEIVGGKLHVKRAGTTTISALQMGNDTYNAASIVSYELTVPKQTQVITFEALPEFTSGDKDYTIVATSNNPNADLSYVCPSNQVAIVWNKYVRECLATGSSTVTVSAEGDDYFTAAEAKQTIKVKSKIHVVPCQIEAEYCTTKSGVNVTRWSNSVFYLNSWESNDYAEYTIDVPADGVYQVEIKAAAPAAGKKLKIVSGTTTLATATLTQGPSLTNFKSTKVNVDLKKGVQTIKIVGIVGGYNFDYMKITSNGGGIIDPDPDPDPDPEPINVDSLKSKLLFYYPLENNSDDLSGNDNDGLLGDAVTFDAGKVGQAATLSHQLGSYLVTPDSIYHYSYETAYTIAFWLKLANISGREDILQPVGGRTLLYSGGDLSFSTYHQKNKVTFSLNSGERESWNHIAMVIDQRNGKTTHKFYVNGVQRGDIASGYALETDKPQSMSRLIFGSSSADVLQRNMSGAIDEVYMFGDVLSESEIAYLVESDNLMEAESTVLVNSVMPQMNAYFSNRQLYIDVPYENGNQFRIYSLTGQLKMFQPFGNKQFTQALNLDAGIYIIQLRSGGLVENKKILVE